MCSYRYGSVCMYVRLGAALCLYILLNLLTQDMQLLYFVTDIRESNVLGNLCNPTFWIPLVQPSYEVQSPY